MLGSPHLALGIRGTCGRARVLNCGDLRTAPEEPVSQHSATISWHRSDHNFLNGRYSRGHSWEFDGGIRVPASASPHIVPVPMSVREAVDPEEAFVAALSSCHMLWFLSLAAGAGYIVDAYQDLAVGSIEDVGAASLAMTRVLLRPRVAFAGDRRPTPEEHLRLHHEAHERCFLARSVRAHISCEPEEMEESNSRSIAGGLATDDRATTRAASS